MRRLVLVLAATGLVLTMTTRAPAQEGALAVIDKAINAHGGAEKLAKIKALQLKTKGTLDILGGLQFQQASSVDMAGKIKDVMEMEVMGQQVTVKTVYDGKQGWINVNGQTMDMDEKLLGMLKEVTHLTSIGRLTPLKDKKFELSVVGEMKVNNSPAIGIKVSSAGHKDVNLYFDKKTGLLAKTELRNLDYMTMQEVAEERIVLDYQDVDGQKAPKRMLINRDGKKFMEAEITDVKYLTEIDASEFAKP
jgi:hypothetical protein